MVLLRFARNVRLFVQVEDRRLIAQKHRVLVPIQYIPDRAKDAVLRTIARAAHAARSTSRVLLLPNVEVQHPNVEAIVASLHREVQAAVLRTTAVAAVRLHKAVSPAEVAVAPVRRLVAVLLARVEEVAVAVEAEDNDVSNNQKLNI